MEPFKNLFSPELVAMLAHHLGQHLQTFDPDCYYQTISERLPDLELKERAQLIADKTHDVLPGNPADRADILLAILHPDDQGHADQPASREGICGWGIMPLSMVVGQHGVQDFDRGLYILKEMTKRFSSEFAIRYFLLADQARTVNTLESWLDDPNHHVRRLISEGTRPRLPWAMQIPDLIKDPAPVLPLLNALKDDPSAYVRRSVANHLNDISKDHPSLIAEIAADWIQDADKDRLGLIKHACRSLIKKGDPKVLAVFGQKKPSLAPVSVRLSKEVIHLGETQAIIADLTSTASEAQSLTVDYIVHFQKANGRLAPKVFKGKVLSIKPGQTIRFEKNHTFKPVTTRVHYPGSHAISLRINGEDTEHAFFSLTL